MRRLSRLVTVETGLALVALAIVALMAVTPPARHEQPTWPLAFRLSLEALSLSPEARARTLVGSQVTVLGLVAVLASWPVRRLRLPLVAGGVVVALAGSAIALPALAVDAYPTTFRRPEVAYHASSIAEGAALYADRCAVCHGPEGGGDGPAAAGLHPRPPDLRAHHANLHTAGDFFWWITTGLGPMPAFGDRLAPEERWHVINFVRALAAADSARLLGSVVERDRPWLVAPDFTFAVGPTAARALKDYRGQRIVLVVLYTLPASRTRLAQLAQHYGTLSTLGVEVIAVPTDAAPDTLRRLGGEPPWILFPVVTEGAREIVRTYRLLSPAPHAEFLVDRQGYVRAITGALGDASREINLLLAEVQTLNEERPAPPPDEHVH
jgi:putative copper resistance protein D